MVAFSPDHSWGIGSAVTAPCDPVHQSSQDPKLPPAPSPKGESPGAVNQENPLCLVFCSHFPPFLVSPSHPCAGCSPNSCPTAGLEFSSDFPCNPPQGRAGNYCAFLSDIQFLTPSFLNLIPSFLPSTPGGSDSTS